MTQQGKCLPRCRTETGPPERALAGGSHTIPHKRSGSERWLSGGVLTLPLLQPVSTQFTCLRLATASTVLH